MGVVVIGIPVDLSEEEGFWRRVERASTEVECEEKDRPAEECDKDDHEDGGGVGRALKWACGL